MKNPRELGIPEEDTPPEVLGTIHFALVSLGTELGQLYDSRLSVEIGPNWLVALGRERNKHYTLNDPHFVLSEPLKYADSPTRWCLPRGGAFYNSLEGTLRVRNAWAHFEIPTYNFEALRPSIETIGQFAYAAGLPVASLCSRIIKRINAIANGQYHPHSSASPREDIEIQLRALEEELEQAKTREDSLAADILAAQALLDEASSTKLGQPSGEYVQQMEVQLLEAAQEMERLQFLIESLAAQQGDDDLEVEVTDILPGEEWNAALPSRRTVMMGLANDLFDESTKAGVAQEFGQQAHDVISSWRPILPAMSPVLLTSTGQAVAHLDGVATYLGSLGEPVGASSEQTSQAAHGFFIPQTYTLRLNGRIEDRGTGESLLNVNPDAAEPVGLRLLDAVPRGGRLRVTTTGDVARHQDGKWVVVAHVTDADWFPGHLAGSAQGR